MSKSNKPSADYQPVPLSDHVLAPSDSAAHFDDLDDHHDHEDLRNGGSSSSSSSDHPESVPLTSSASSAPASPAPRPDTAILHISDSDNEDAHDDNQPLALADKSSTQVPRKVLTSSADGVFANLSAKPEPVTRGAATAEGAADAPTTQAAPVELPPSYEAAVSDPTPTYWDTTVFTTQLDDGEVLVEGLPVGSSLTFVLSSMVSVAFQFVGFLMTYLLATSHAGRCGAKAGFGLTLLQYGMVVRNRVEIIEDGDNPFVDDDFNASLPPGTTPDERMAILDRTEWIAYLLMLLGWFLVIKSMFEYMRAKRLQALVMASPETLVA
ncbi:hypothetical protein BCR44DRAFT_1394004 [Catenaria anguillulae PL171]|uniref:Metal homeostatis protein bsd2 n=1 Tax=Catenaria anguillulae PL171 TaxID=765915 RepID=A0A1Y2H902_9FUNG|nr:hypothetical protein BCR44DRAFT_1394004 [Catenaria anguillulae PL171]